MPGIPAGAPAREPGGEPGGEPGPATADASRILEALGTRPEGLSAEEAETRLRRGGPNRLPQPRGPGAEEARKAVARRRAPDAGGIRPTGDHPPGPIRRRSAPATLDP